MTVRYYPTVKSHGWVELWAHKASVYWFAASAPIRFITDKEALTGDIWALARLMQRSVRKEIERVVREMGH